MNYLEGLMTEWLKYTDWIILDTGKKVGKRDRGGWAGELDVVAYHPERKRVWHIECSMDADTWETRENKFRRKFEAGRTYIPQLYPHLIPNVVPAENIDQAVLFGAVMSKEKHATVGDGQVLLMKELLTEIATELQGKLIQRQAVPEAFPILRTIQYTLDHQVGLGFEVIPRSQARQPV